METEVGRILVRILGDAGGYLKALGTASAATQAFSNTVSGLLGALGGAAIQAAGQFEQLEISFRVLTGSAALASKTIRELVDFAVTTPFEVPQVVQAAKQMIAFGTNARDIIGVMRMLGDISASLGTPLGDLVYLFGTLRAQGRAYMLDINQFAMRGIPIWEALGKVLGVTKAEVRSLVTAGEVGFEQVEKAFQQMTEEGGKFNGMMAEQAKSLFGMWSNLKDSAGVFLRSLGGLLVELTNLKGIIGLLTSALGVLGKMMNSVAAWFQNLDPLTQSMVKTLVTIVPLFLALQAALAVIISLVGLFTARIVSLYGALTRLGVAMAANPFTIWLAALAAIVVAIQRVIDGIENMGETVPKAVAEGAFSLVDMGGGMGASIARRAGGTLTRPAAGEGGRSYAEMVDARTTDIISRSGSITGPRSRKDFLSGEMAEMRRLDAPFARMRSVFEGIGAAAPDYLLPFRRGLERLETELDKTSASMRDAEHKAKSFLETMAGEAATMGMSKREAERYRLALAGVSGETLRLVDAAIKITEMAEAQKKLSEDTKDFTNRLFDQQQTLGMSSLQAERYRLAARGADEVTLSWADSMITAIEAFERHQRLLERGRSLTERFLTPHERLGRTQVELNELYAGGAISLETYTRALAAAARETRNLANESRDALLVGSVEARRFAEQYEAMLRAPVAFAPTLPGRFGPSVAGVGGPDMGLERLTEIRDGIRAMRGAGLAVVPAAFR